MLRGIRTPASLACVDAIFIVCIGRPGPRSLIEIIRQTVAAGAWVRRHDAPRLRAAVGPISQELEPQVSTRQFVPSITPHLYVHAPLYRQGIRRPHARPRLA